MIEAKDDSAPCVIFDLDGTLCNIQHRLHFVQNEPKNWMGFFEGLKDDHPEKAIEWLLRVLAYNNTSIILCSGRPEDYRVATEQWLERFDFRYEKLYMRKQGDYRPDHIVKEELLHQILEDGYNPMLVVDDRQSVVDMWRDNGLMCLQCAPNDQSNTNKRMLGKNMLWLLVGPSGAGKSHTLENMNYDARSVFKPSLILSSDEFRENICGDFRDQTQNRKVFEALHATARTAMKNGVMVTIDATHLKRQDRLASVACAPAGTTVTYVIVDRPLEEKLKDAGWRAEVPGLIERHHKAFQSSLKDIRNGDGLSNVIVVDLRSKL